MLELMTLAGNGMGQGAMKICRTLMETVVNADYLRQWPAELDAYLNWSWVEKKKELEYVRQHLPHLLPDISPEAIGSIEKEFQATRASFQKPTATFVQVGPA